jgi:hypothetical protein
VALNTIIPSLTETCITYTDLTTRFEDFFLKRNSCPTQGKIHTNNYNIENLLFLLFTYKMTNMIKMDEMKHKNIVGN